MMIELAEVVRQLRNELDKARTAAEHETLQFELGPIELEVAVGLEKEGAGSAKVRFWVAEIGGDLRATATSTQRIKLRLHPVVGGDSARAHANPGSVYVTGDETSGER